MTHKRVIASLLCAVMALSLLAGCGKAEPEPETNAEGMTRPHQLTEAKVPKTDEFGTVITNADGSAVMVDTPKTAPEGNEKPRMAWPLDRLPAALPVAAQHIDRLDDRAAGAIVYVTEMPYEDFLAYTAKLKEAGLKVENEFLPEEVPPLKRAMLTGELGEWRVVASWVTEKYPGFIANFELLIEGA